MTACVINLHTMYYRTICLKYLDPKKARWWTLLYSVHYIFPLGSHVLFSLFQGLNFKRHIVGEKSEWHYWKCFGWKIELMAWFYEFLSEKFKIPGVENLNSLSGPRTWLISLISERKASLLPTAPCAHATWQGHRVHVAQWVRRMPGAPRCKNVAKFEPLMADSGFW